MRLSAPDYGQLRASLSELLGRLQSVQAIESGTTGQSFRVATADGTFAVKHFDIDASCLLGPLAQHRLLERLAPLDIAPCPVAADDTRRLLITEWIDNASPARLFDLAHPERIAALAAVLRALHAVDYPIPAFSPQDYVTRYVDAVGGQDQLGSRDQARLAELHDLVSSLAWHTSEPGVCHNDLAAENIFIGDKLRLIDFDFAVSGPPILDLASVAEMNRFDAGAERALVTAYFGGDAAQLRELAPARRLLCLLAHFWALAKANAGADIVNQYRIDND